MKTLLALFLALSLVLTGCVDYLAPPVIAVNESEKALTEINTTLAQIESRQLTDAINAAKTVEEAKAAKDAIAKRYHPSWEALDKAVAAWVVAKVLTQEALTDEQNGKKPAIARVIAAVLDLSTKQAAIGKAVQELLK